MQQELKQAKPKQWQVEEHEEPYCIYKLMKENSLKSIKYAEDAKSTRKATLEAKFNKNLSNSAPVMEPGTNDHHTKPLTLIWWEPDIRINSTIIISACNR